jgi:succinate dehydrogenase/fumarate reductase cytochrome b subunit
MIQKNPKDFYIWLFWLTTTLIPLIFALDKRWRYQYSDKTGITTVIIILFIVSLVINIINTIRIFIEFSKLKNSQGLFKEHITTLERAAQGKLSISQDFSLMIIENRLLRNEKMSEASEKLLSISSNLNREIFQLQISSQVQKQENLEKLLNQIVIVLNVIQKLTYILIVCIFIFIVIFVLSLIN